MANSVDLDETAHYSGSALFAKVSVHACRDERFMGNKETLRSFFGNFILQGR